MDRYANIHWHGNLRKGDGRISTQSGTLENVNYTFKKRFGSEKGTNPEELIAAAHGACFSMALANELSERNLEVESIDVNCKISTNFEEGKFDITESYLDVKVSVPGGNQKNIEEAAVFAKENCPVSKVLNCDIVMDLNVENSFQAELS